MHYFLSPEYFLSDDDYLSPEYFLSSQNFISAEYFLSPEYFLPLLKEMAATYSFNLSYVQKILSRKEV